MSPKGSVSDPERALSQHTSGFKAEEAGKDSGKRTMHLRQGYRSLVGKNKFYLPHSTFKYELAVGMESQSLETFETRLDKASENILLEAIL